MRTSTLTRALPLEIGGLTALLIWASISLFAPFAPPAASAGGFSDPASSSDPFPSGISPIFAPAVQFWGPEIRGWAAQYGVDPELAATVMQIESCGNPQAESEAGALGLFQVMPSHFRAGENPWDPQTNARRGLSYLASDMRQARGQIVLALAAYNGGPARVTQGQFDWPSQTQRYVYWAAGIYEDARRGSASSQRLQDWQNAGGASLCRQAARTLRLPRA